MWIGDVVDDRFVIERPLGSGGMGSVFLATDRVEGGSVAVKVLDHVSDDAVERFRREIRILSSLSHPAIVRHLAHGETQAKEPFLAMELLVGEDLSSRLSRSALAADESLDVVRRAAEALSFAHARGIVHRDVKPRNLFLVGGDVSQVKVLDFGCARDDLQSVVLTGTGTMLGTVGYMAPEQASGAKDIDGRVDVFALGCVLFECLTGRPVFEGQHAIAVLAKLLGEDAPNLGECAPELPDALGQLVARMLTKRPEGRPVLSDVRTALEAIAASMPRRSRPTPAPVRASLTNSERRIVSVILAEPSSQEATSTTSSSTDQGIAELRALAEAGGAELVPLPRGALLLVFSGGGTASDRAARAARCALSLRGSAPGLRVTLATGSAETTGPRLPVGPAIDRAAGILRGEASTGQLNGGVPLDDVSASLLGTRFEIVQQGARRVLVGERFDLGAPRPLMGRATPTVGRDRELAILDATLAECVEESVSRVVLITSPPGVGKSRVATEFLKRVSQRGGTRVLIARADPMSAGSSLGLTQQLVQHVAGLREGVPAAAQASRLRELVSEHVPVERRDAVVQFLSEIIGAPSDREPSPVLHAARNDPAVMQEQKRSAFETLIDALLRSAPLLVVLEDLHWGDPPTVRFLSEALERHAERALCVLALARPEVHDRFPRLWERCSRQLVELGGLSRKSSERLIRDVLGEAVESDLVERVVERAGGNAFYLEELIRRVGEGDGALPDTVLAMAESRLERLEPEARRVLRAASVFGETCWSGGVGALLGGSLDSAGWLESLADREVLVRSPTSRFVDQSEYVFRHALLRDAAYGTLTASDHRNAHGLAGAWLEAKDEGDPRVIADHFERAEDAGRAVPWMRRAAQEALEMGDARAAIELGQRGCSLGASGEDRGKLLAVEGLANVVNNLPCTETMRLAVPLLRAGSALWWVAVGSPIVEAAGSGKPEDAAEFAQLAFAAQPSDNPSGPCGIAVGGVTGGLLLMGQVQSGLEFLARFEDAQRRTPARDPTYAAWLESVRAFADYYDDEWRLERGLGLAEHAITIMKECGATLGELCSTFHAAKLANMLGLYARAETTATRALSLSERYGASWQAVFSNLHIAFAQMRTAQVPRAIALLESLDQLNPIQAQLRNAWLADAWSRSGEWSRAEALARDGLTGPSPHSASLCAAVLARIALAQNRPEQCLEVGADFAHSFPTARADIWTSHALAQRSLGRNSDAASSAARARRLVLEVAERIQDENIRRGFLTNVEECARTIATAQELGI
jgi:eukaryotic-like serine/threonine-protein kinase